MRDLRIASACCRPSGRASTAARVIGAAALLTLTLTPMLTACGGGGDGAGTSGGGSTAAAPPPAPGGPPAPTVPTPAPSPAVPDFAAPADPVRAQAQPDTARAVSVTLPPSGGTLQAVAADGARFELTVPDGALATDTRITLTPISGLVGLPFAASVADPAGTSAVLIEPADTRLSQLATLRFAPATVAPLAEQTLFAVRAPAAGASAGELHLLPPTADRTVIETRLAHFGVVGLARATAAERVALQARLPTLLADRWSHLVADGVVTQRATPAPRRLDLLPGPIPLVPMAEVYATILLGQAGGIPGDCEQAWFYIDTNLRLGLLVTQSTPEAFTSATVRLSLISVGRLIDAAAVRCQAVLKLQCQQHDLRALIPMIQWKAALDSWVQPLEATGFAARQRAGEMAPLVDGCARFELDFQSTATGVATTAPGSYEGQVRVQMPIRLVAPTLPLRWFGTAPLLGVRFTLSGACPTLTTGYIGSVLAGADELRLVPDQAANVAAPQPNLPITNVELDYTPGRDLANVLIQCPNTPPIPVVFDGAWYATFVNFHVSEFNADQLHIRDWQFIGEELYARKTWQHADPVAGGVAAESTNIDLFHRPVLP